MRDTIKRVFNADDVHYIRGDGSKSNPKLFWIQINGVGYKVLQVGNLLSKINYNGVKNERVKI